MNIAITAEGKLDLESAVVSLHDLQPVFNGAPLDNARAEIVQQDATGVELRYSAPALKGGTFGVKVTREGAARARMHYWLENMPASLAVDAFGIQFSRVENLRAYLRNGYQSWDGSFYVELEGPSSTVDGETGYAMTQLLPRFGGGSLVIGFERHEQFQQTFAVNRQVTPPGLTVQTVWDRKHVASSSETRLGWRGESGPLVLFEHGEIEEALREWARLVAQAAERKPRQSPPILGWCSWYNLYASITEENILDHLRRVQKIVRQEQLPMRVFQIDDGFTPEMGDWLDVKPQFPRGMRPLLDDIRAAGFVPGLWIAPFMVGNRSRLYREHPEWVVQDAAGGPLVERRFYGEFRWHKRSEEYYILDTTQPDAFDYLRNVFRTWQREWGAEYFKTDFMYFGSEHGPARAVWHAAGMTRIEIWRRVAEMIRSEIGEALWLGCGCPLWASIGLVDGIRIGRDVGVEWRGNLSAQSLLRDQVTRNFANHILWQSDPDCVLLRHRFHHLTAAELHALAIFAGMSGGVLTTSDALDELSPDRLRLWKLLLSPGVCRLPLLGQADPALVQVRGSGDRHAIFIFNTSETTVQRTFPLAALGVPAPRYVYDWIRQQPFNRSPIWDVSVTLAAHEGALLFLSPSPLESAPERLP